MAAVRGLIIDLWSASVVADPDLRDEASRLGSLSVMPCTVLHTRGWVK